MYLPLTDILALTMAVVVLYWAYRMGMIVLCIAAGLVVIYVVVTVLGGPVGLFSHQLIHQFCCQYNHWLY